MNNRRFGKVMYGTAKGKRKGKYRNLEYESNANRKKDKSSKDDYKDPWEYYDYDYRSGLF